MITNFSSTSKAFIKGVFEIAAKSNKKGICWIAMAEQLTTAV